MVYGYARVSTDGQDRYGNSLMDQMSKLKEAGCAEVLHDSFTGTKMERPEFTRLMGTLKSGDRLVVTKLDRFARTTSGGIETIKALMERGVAIHILNMGLIDNTPTGRLIVTILLAFAEFERDQIVERTQTGKAAARAKNPEWREGRKEIEIDPAVLAECQRAIAGGEKTVGECCKELGISRATWYNRVKDMETRCTPLRRFA